MSEPLFWYRPVGEDGGYEGPINSKDFATIPAGKRLEWEPLFPASNSIFEAYSLGFRHGCDESRADMIVTTKMVDTAGKAYDDFCRANNLQGSVFYDEGMMSAIVAAFTADGRASPPAVINIWHAMALSAPRQASPPAENVMAAEIPPHVRDFIGKVQGVCMGVAMSGEDHPNPEEVLMDLVTEAQEILFPQLAKLEDQP